MAVAVYGCFMNGVRWPCYKALVTIVIEIILVGVFIKGDRLPARLISDTLSGPANQRAHSKQAETVVPVENRSAAFIGTSGPNGLGNPEVETSGRSAKRTISLFTATERRFVQENVWVSIFHLNTEHFRKPFMLSPGFSQRFSCTRIEDGNAELQLADHGNQHASAEAAGSHQGRFRGKHFGDPIEDLSCRQFFQFRSPVSNEIVLLRRRPERTVSEPIPSMRGNHDDTRLSLKMNETGVRKVIAKRTFSAVSDVCRQESGSNQKPAEIKMRPNEPVLGADFVDAAEPSPSDVSIAAEQANEQDEPTLRGRKLSASVGLAAQTGRGKRDAGEFSDRVVVHRSMLIADRGRACREPCREL